MKIYIVTTLYLYRDLSGRYTAGNSDYYTPYLFTNKIKAKGFISQIIERWNNDGYFCAREPSNINEKLSNFNKCIWEYINITNDEKRVIILDPTLTD